MYYKKKSSLLERFLKTPQISDLPKKKDQQISRIIADFKNKVARCMIYSDFFNKLTKVNDGSEQIKFLMKTICGYNKKLLKNYKEYKSL